MFDFNTREDDFSFQITTSDSKRFFLRVVSPEAGRNELVFSDFLLDINDNARAVSALHILREEFCSIQPSMKLVFQDIYPRFFSDNNRNELVRRHDQIVSVVKQYASEVDLEVEKAFLDQKAGIFESVILIK